MRVVDPESLAQRIEAVALAGEHFAREAQRVGQLRVGSSTHLMSGQRELEVEERNVEGRVVDDPLGAAGEIEALTGEVAEFRLASQVGPRLAMNFPGSEIDVGLGAAED